MRLLLIRHGESVDNVAGLLAGSRDAPLTSHGVLQTKRLAAHLASRRALVGPVKKILTSNLQRAFHTAEAVAKAQPKDAAPEVVQLPELREKDFGSSEGKKFGSRAEPGAGSSSKADAETHAAMAARIRRFLDRDLSPLLVEHASDNVTVVIVAHGIILNVLLKALAARYPRAASAQDKSEISAAWGNTGVLQAKLVPDPSRAVSKEVASKDDVGPGPTESDSTPATPRLEFMIEFINNQDHLQGLKKTRGGIGSAQFDSKQRTMDSFFKSTPKKRKLEE